MIDEFHDQLTALSPEQRDEFVRTLPDDQKEELTDFLIETQSIWNPLPGPQTAALESEADIVFYGGAAGGGKLLPLDTKLVTPFGFIEMGKVDIGDTLIDKDGNYCKVTQLSDIDLTPELVEFEFDDATKVTSCVDHQWLTFDAKELSQLTRSDPEWQSRRRAKRLSRATGKKSEKFSKMISQRNSENAKLPNPFPTGSVRTTRQIMATLYTTSGRKNHAIPLAGIHRSDAIKLQVEPYTFGAWLGDGTSKSGGFTSIDPEIWERISQDGYEVTHSATDDKSHYIRGVMEGLRELNCISNKHIPQKYLRCSYGKRLELLRGLMDTDGTVAKHSGSAEFCNTNEAIIDGAVELICSLGWKVNKREGRAKINGKDCGPKWTLKFVPGEYVFNLSRKRILQKLATRRTCAFRYIKHARSVPSTPGRCITVDSPSATYLIGPHMQVTHNTDMLVGTAISDHLKSIIFRREATQLTGIIDRMTELLGGRGGFNGQEKIWRLPAEKRQVEFGSVPNPGDETRYQGRPHDLIGFDEISNFLEFQFRFLMGWLRTTVQGQRCRVICAGNPPTNSDGDWVRQFWGPWLDPFHPDPAKPGELRWYYSLDGKDHPVDNGDMLMLDKETGVRAANQEEIDDPLCITIQPKSRTFIPSRVTDNPYLMGTGYMATLQALPEPLRSQMLYGDFTSGQEDDAWQAIPSEWVRAAQRRWLDHPANKFLHSNEPRDTQYVPTMTAVGVDVSRGGKDESIICPLYDNEFYDTLEAIPGHLVPDGPSLGAEILKVRRDRAPVCVDAIGVGTSVVDWLESHNIPVTPITGNEKGFGRDNSGTFKFRNMRAKIYWGFRESLDPKFNSRICIPPDGQLLADLCAARYKILEGNVIQIESKVDLKKRLGRSTDRGDGVIYASSEEHTNLSPFSFGKGQVTKHKVIRGSSWR